MSDLHHLAELGRQVDISLRRETTMDEVKVIGIREAVQSDRAGKIQTVLRVEFMVGEHGPFTESFSKEGFDSSAMLRALDEFAQKIRAVVKS